MRRAVGNESKVMTKPESNGATLLVHDAIVISLVALKSTRYALRSWLVGWESRNSAEVELLGLTR